MDQLYVISGVKRACKVGHQRTFYHPNVGEFVGRVVRCYEIRTDLVSRNDLVVSVVSVLTEVER